MSNLIAVIFTTEHRGVFFGYIDKNEDLTKETLGLKDAKMAIKWATKKGICELASIGPNDQSLIGAKADIPVIHKITAVFLVEKEAEEKWILA